MFLTFTPHIPYHLDVIHATGWPEMADTLFHSQEAPPTGSDAAIQFRDHDIVL